MRFLGLFFSSALTLILSLGVTLKANADEVVMCPGLDKIRQVAPLINLGRQVGMTYQAGTDKTVFTANNRNWAIAVDNIAANSVDDAISKAQMFVPKITVMWSEVADWMGDTAICIYFVPSSPMTQYVLAMGFEKPSVAKLPRYFLTIK